MKLILVVAAVVAVVCLQCDAKTFTRCELVRELRKQNFPASQLRDWVCLVEAESGRHTHVIQGRYHGLYQIDDRVWCNNSHTPGKNCNVTCAQLRTDDITRASTCAKRIFQQHGFSWWGGWVTRCRSLPDISNC